MNMKAFFEKFEIFADAPNAVAKMRELVLTLAVQGKLVPQDPKDEPAEELFNKIQKDDVDRSSLLKRNSSIVEPAEFHHDIPEHWVWCELQEISDFINGKAHEQFVTDEPGFALVNSRFVSNSGRIFKYSTQQLTPLFRGDIALVMSDVPDGRALARCFVVDEDDRYTLNQRIGCIRTSDLLCKAYLALVLDRNAYFLQYDDGKKQTNLKKIQIVSCPVPLPPLAEQLRIVAKVEELMALCDRLEAQQQEREEKHKALSRASLARFADAPTPANLQFIFHPSYTIAPADLRKSILTLAVQGKLVPQDPKDEPAEELFNKIQKDDVDRSSLLKRNSSIVEPAEFHHDIPEHWVWCELQEISDFINGKAHEQFVTDEPGFALVNSRFVSNSGRIFKYSTQQLTPLFRGDIALVMSDVPDGRALARCFVVDEDDRYTLNQRIGCIRTSDLLCKAYLALVLDRNAYFLQYDDGKKQTNLKKIQIVSCPVPLPPLAEQLRIVAKVEELMKLVDALETQLATSRATAANLLAALVAELTGTPNTGKVSVPASTSTGTGRRGRPPKS